MKNALNSALKVLWIVQKDVQVEFRRAYEILSILAFTAGSILICSFAWKGGLTFGPEVTSAALWVILFFASILTFTTSFTREMDRGTIGGLKSLPCSSFAILLGKAFYSIIILLIVQSIMLPSAIIFLNLKIPVEGILPLIAVFTLGIVNLSFVGSFISALVMFSEGKNLLLSFLLFPVSVPVLVPCLIATEKIATSMAMVSIDAELRLLLAFLFFILFITLLTFERVLED